MRFLPKVPVIKQQRVVTDKFLGYNRNLTTADGEFYDMSNMTSSFYPMLSVRKPRYIVRTDMKRPWALAGKDKLAMISNGSFYYDGLVPDMILSDEEPKSMVTMGAFILIFPDKIYFNTADRSFGNIEAHFTAQLSTSNPVKLSICTADGTSYAAPSADEPQDPQNGDLWMDTSGKTAALMQYSSALGMWSQVPTVYTRIECQGIGQQFQVGDGVEIEGLSCSDENVELKNEINNLCGSKVIFAKDDNSIVVVGIIRTAYTQNSGALSAQRKIPKMDFVIESQNRLWGCRYSFENGTAINEIYCSKLGDFKNWNCFAGIATDSWVGSVGSAGPFTGAVNFMGCPTFFKENIIHRVGVSSVGAHRITETVCRGVQKGSHNSICIVNEMLYYKSPIDVCVYDGVMPVSVSAALGDEQYYRADAGAFDGKYYICMSDEANNRRLFVYDTVRRLWHAEDYQNAECFADCAGELYYIVETTDGEGNNFGRLISLTGKEGYAAEEKFSWSVLTGIQHYRLPDKKYISRYNIRMKMEQGARVNVAIRYDGGDFTDYGKIETEGTDTVTVPIRPRRCDHMQLLLSGVGDVKILSISRILETGSDV